MYAELVSTSFSRCGFNNFESQIPNVSDCDNQNMAFFQSNFERLILIVFKISWFWILNWWNHVMNKISGLLRIYDRALSFTYTTIFIQFLRSCVHHGLRTPNEAFFHWNSELMGLSRQIGEINSRAFGVFSAKLSLPILVQWVPCPCFPLFNHYFYKKLSLYIHIPNIYLGLGFEFGPQRIRDLAFVCP